MLRRRQAASVALPSRTVLEGIVGAVAAVKGVRRYSAYENDTDTTDGNGLPSHSIALVVEGGDAERIAQAIAAKKTPGAGTYGTTTTLIHDRYGIEHPIRFFRPVEVPVTVRIALNALAGYTSAVGQAIQQAVSEYVNARAIGEPLRAARLYVPANLNGQPDSETFDITALSIARPDAANARLEMPVAFNEAVHCAPSDVKLTVH
ncbi:putative bacteriophage protein (fragment) [Candidatus Glomeribacter gigasporarum BEG34]|uniref:Putative bacteriophage protein n=1 Tax=Candidatus Glomeribacter gigasporarum BEG34 TaxID=1070319 RepID=G2JBR5_9BURK